MQSIQHTVITTSSGIVGGVSKAVSSGFTLGSISLPHLLDVAFYAAISAFIGYSIKLGIDELRNYFRKRRNS